MNYNQQKSNYNKNIHYNTYIEPGVYLPIIYSYITSSLPLYASAAGPQYTDAYQGYLGDCWLMSALNETAYKNPKLINNMIQNNNNGTYTVNFEVPQNWAGWTNETNNTCKIDPITVDASLPNFSSIFYKQNINGNYLIFSQSNTCIWSPLIEKAAAQLSAQFRDPITGGYDPHTGLRYYQYTPITGCEYPDGTGNYYTLTAGWGEGLSLLTGQNWGTFSLSASNFSTCATNFSNGYEMLMGTNATIPAGLAYNNLVAGHMFAVLGFNTVNNSVELYNPWGAAEARSVGKLATFWISQSALTAAGVTFFYTPH